MKFFDPVIDKENSIKIVIHLLNINNELVPTMELEYPNEEDLTRESLVSMLEALEYSSQKIIKVLEVI